MSRIITSTNNKIPYEEFKNLMEKATNFLNKLAKNKNDELVGVSSEVVENLVFEAMKKAAIGTPFENTIELVSGKRFPDIIAGHYYGTEVKSTKTKKWETFGNSIFEGTRVEGIDRIYLTFGKMSNPVEFRSKPYDKCISEVVIDHSPRYHIDMNIQEDNRNTIFEDMNISYDDFRNSETLIQVNLVAKRSKGNLKEGETLWWSPNSEENIVGQKLTVLSTLTLEEREKITAEALALFPELFGSSNPNKYNRYLMWLIKEKNIVTGNVRDSFSSGGRLNLTLKDGSKIKIPAVMRRVLRYKDLIKQRINETSEETLKENWNVEVISNNRLR